MLETLPVARQLPVEVHAVHHAAVVAIEVSLYVPTGHVVSAVAPAAQKLPAVHAVHAPAEARFVAMPYLPMGHGRGALAPASQYEPAVHGPHVCAPGPEKVPPTHATGAAAPPAHE